MLLNNEKKAQLINDYELFWQHKLDRPIMYVNLVPHTTGQYNPYTSKARMLKMMHDENIKPEDVAKEYRNVFNNEIYLGDGFPLFYLRSIGVLGGMMDEPYSMDEVNGTIWFEELHKEPEDIHMQLNKNSQMYRRGMQLYKAMQEEFGDDVAFGVPDFGFVNDIYSSLRGSNNSLMDLYDAPEEVLRVYDEIYDAFKEAYIEFNEVINKGSKLGYTAWIPLLSQIPYNVGEADFICMISKQMAGEFVIPYLKKCNDLMDRCFYHLDGPGAVMHLPEIIDIGFDGVQWINGAGAAPLDDEKWTHIYKEVLEAGQLLQVFVYSAEELRFMDHLYNMFGSLKNIAFICYGSQDDEEQFLKYMDKYNIPR